MKILSGKRRWILLGVTLLCIVGVLTAVRVRHRQGMVYQGKPLFEWAIQLFESPDQKRRQEAATVFKQLGPAAVPDLIRLLQIKDSIWRKKFWGVASKFPVGVRRGLAGWVPLPTVSVRSGAARALGIIGPDARSAIGELGEAVQDRELQVATEAADALGRIGSESVEELLQALQVNDPDTRRLAAYALSEIGPGAERAIPQLLECQLESNSHVRSLSGRALIHIGEPALVAVLDAIQQGTAARKIAAAKLLPGFTPPPKRIFPAMSGMAQDADPTCRRQALETLAAIRPSSTNVVQLFFNALDDPVPQVRIAAIKALAQAGRKGQPAVPRLIAFLDDPSAEVRLSSMRTLGSLGSYAHAAIPHLQRLTEDHAESTRLAANEALAQIGAGTNTSPSK